MSAEGPQLLHAGERGGEGGKGGEGGEGGKGELGGEGELGGARSALSCGTSPGEASEKPLKYGAGYSSTRLIITSLPISRMYSRIDRQLRSKKSGPPPGGGGAR